MTELGIKLATLADLDDIHRLEVSAFTAPWKREFFESELRASGRLNLVARRSGIVVGYVFAMWFFDEMHINKIAVAHEERRRGVASDLMEKCFRFARANRIASITLEVRKSNIGAQEFYSRLDFDSTYVRPRYYPDGEAAVVMTRKMS